MSSDDFSACDPSDLCSCVDQCQRAFATVQEDSVQKLDVEARHAECKDDRCRVVLRADDKCFADFKPNAGSAFDCALSDDEIVAMAPSLPSVDLAPPLACGQARIGGTTWYTECKWSKLCGGVCGSPVCSAQGDNGKVVCAYEPDE